MSDMLAAILGEVSKESKQLSIGVMTGNVVAHHSGTSYTSSSHCVDVVIGSGLSVKDVPVMESYPRTTVPKVNDKVLMLVTRSNRLIVLGKFVNH